MLSLDWNILWTFINLIILFLILKKFLFKPITKIMNERQRQIEASFADAQKQQREANEMHVRYETEIASTKIKAEDIIKDAKEKAKSEYNRIITEAGKEADKLTETARKNLEIQKKKEFEEIQNSLIDVAFSVAMKASAESIDENKSKKLLEELVMKAGA